MEWAKYNNAINRCATLGGRKPEWVRRDLQIKCLKKFNQSNPLSKCKKAKIPPKINKPNKPKSCKDNLPGEYNALQSQCKVYYVKSDNEHFKKYNTCFNKVWRKYAELKALKCVIEKPFLRLPKRKKKKHSKCDIKKWEREEKKCKNKANKILGQTAWRPSNVEMWSWKKVTECVKKLNNSKNSKLCGRIVKVSKKPVKPTQKKKICKAEVWSKEIQKCRNFWKK